jgi:hypothetical protein
MKRTVLFSVLMMLGVVKANAMNVGDALNQAIMQDARNTQVALLANRAAIDWKVGETQDFKVTLSVLQGSAHKEVKSEENDAIWIQTDINLLIQQVQSRMLIRRADAKILKFQVNGKDESLPSDPEIVDQANKTVTVPAGTFDCLWVKAKVMQNGQENVSELWVSPGKVSMEGTVKMKTEAMGMEVVMELTKFGF